MKIVHLETIRLNDGSYKLRLNDEGITPPIPNTLDKSGEDVAVGKVSEDAIYYHHLDREDTRYLIYIKGYLGRLDGNEIPNLERALGVYLNNQNS